MQATDRAAAALVGTVGFGFTAVVDVLSGFTNYAGPANMAAGPLVVTLVVLGWYWFELRQDGHATDVEDASAPATEVADEA